MVIDDQKLDSLSDSDSEISTAELSDAEDLEPFADLNSSTSEYEEVAYVLNDPIRKDLRRHFSKQALESSLGDFCRFVLVTRPKENLPDHTFEALVRDETVPKEEVLSTLAHLKAIETFLQDTDEKHHALIFEDGVTMTGDWKTVRDTLMLIPEDCDICLLGAKGTTKEEWTLTKRVLTGLLNPIQDCEELVSGVCRPSIFIGMHGYMISRKGARNLLDLFERDKIYASFDRQLCDYMKRMELDVLALKQPFVGPYVDVLKMRQSPIIADWITDHVLGMVTNDESDSDSDTHTHLMFWKDHVTRPLITIKTFSLNIYVLIMCLIFTLLGMLGGSWSFLKKVAIVSLVAEILHGRVLTAVSLFSLYFLAHRLGTTFSR